MRKSYLILYLLFCFQAIRSFGQPQPTKSISAVNKDSLRKHIYFLGNDSLRGRATGTRGSEIASEYIANELKKINLIPIGDNNTYYQSIPMHGSIPLKESTLRLYLDDTSYDFELGRDYLLYKCGAQTFLPEPVPLVFVGYGIIAPEFDYNDYQTVDVSGKIAVFLSGEPYSTDPHYFDGANPTIYSYAEAKHRLAISRGAFGSIMILNPAMEKGRTWKDWQDEFSFEDVTLAYSVTSELDIVMNPDAAAKLFENVRSQERKSVFLQQLLNQQKRHGISSFMLPGKISFKGEFIEREFVDRNVIGMVKGDDPDLRDAYLILSAHYDHLGIGPAVDGDSIYNGVMDNAAGVAGILEIARAFTRGANKPKRSIIFLFLTGEEKGLLGSHYYTDHPIRPLYKTIANINVDGLAMFDTFYNVVSIGGELSTLNEMLEKVCGKLSLNISPIPSEFSASESFYRSDQISFAQAGIPSILIMEGLHYQHLSYEQGQARQIQWFRNVYHSAFDDLNQPLNFEAAAEHCNLLFAFCQFLANQGVEPHWKPGSIYMNARLQSIAEKR